MPTHYKKEFLLQLQRLRQGSKGVEEYFKEMDVFLLNIGLKEDQLA